ncbi:FAD/NAD(P)-binding domain-containing protein [Nemania abortiva]|nr:FAD/NAD(P)-binding domain-containing protein [Nemania abortiva]
METQPYPLQVIIIGGSLSGLMCGIALKRAGHHVTIFEKDQNMRQSEMAGIAFGPDMRRFLNNHDCHTREFSHHISQIQSLNSTGSKSVLSREQRDITSWDDLNYRLRSCFDGFSSAYYPEAPSSPPTNGRALFEACQQVIDLERKDPHKMRLTVMDLASGNTRTAEADLVIGADGPNSFVRNKYLPHVQRCYVGYVVWRGTVPERELLASTLAEFNDSLTICPSHQQYCVIYIIPGENGSLVPGERSVNFAWYTNHSEADLDHIMRDSVDGHIHANMVPSGHVRETVWEEQLKRAESAHFSLACLEVMGKVEKPAIQVVSEYSSPRAAFEDGMVLLVGDALCLCRPHTAIGVGQAGFDALAVGDMVAGRASLCQWESRVLRYARLFSWQSVWWGMWYQDSVLRALPFALRYWSLCVVEGLRSLWD